MPSCEPGSPRLPMSACTEPRASRGRCAGRSLQPVNGRPLYPNAEDELRQVARDAYVSWEGSRYSVPWRYARESRVGAATVSGDRGALRKRTDCGACTGQLPSSGDHAARAPCPQTKDDGQLIQRIRMPSRFASARDSAQSFGPRHQNIDPHAAECASGGETLAGRI